MTFRDWFMPKSKQKQKYQKQTTPYNVLQAEGRDQQLSPSLQTNAVNLQQIFGKTIDFHIEPVHVGEQEGLICYLDSMTSMQGMVEKVRKPLALATMRSSRITGRDDLIELRKDLFAGCNYQTHDRYEQVVTALLQGFALLLVEGLDCALALLINEIEFRSIEEPSTQTIVRGPKDGFTENLYTNISLVRRRVKNPRLQFTSYIIGKDTQTLVVTAHVQDVVNPKILKEVQKRLEDINTSSIFDSGNIEEFLQDKTFTPFPTIFNTERPDTVAAHVLEGKVAIIVDNSPFVLLAPTVMTDFFQSPEDYYQAYYMATFVRLIRYLAFLFALLLPAFYLAIVTYHHELIPTQLLISLAAQREGVPFPAVVEVFIMEITFEIVREAGIRMPRAVGQAVSIVGALVIGQAAVEAGIVSNTLVIVVSLTGLSSFVTPIYALSVATRILRFGLMLLASVFGLYGVVLGLIVMVAHLVSLRSFGVPYLSPVAPLIIEDMDDVFIRFPLWAMKTRPKYTETEAVLRQPKSKSPTPPQPKQGGDSS